MTSLFATTVKPVVWVGDAIASAYPIGNSGEYRGLIDVDFLCLANNLIVWFPCCIIRVGHSQLLEQVRGAARTTARHSIGEMSG